MLIVAAGRDRLVSTPAIETFAIHLRAGSHVVIPGAEHEIMMEQDQMRSQFWAAFDAFVPGTPLFSKLAAGLTLLSFTLPCRGRVRSPQASGVGCLLRRAATPHPGSARFHSVRCADPLPSRGGVKSPQQHFHRFRVHALCRPPR